MSARPFLSCTAALTLICFCNGPAARAGDDPAATSSPKTSSSSSSSSWPQWRGPQRTGVSPDSPPLASEWPKDGPPVVWEIEGIPAGGAGGYGSPVVADGRVYLFVNHRYSVPVTHRTVSDGALRQLGWPPQAERPTGALMDALEQARQGYERAGLDPAKVGAWVEAWTAARIPAEADEKRFIPFIQQRLREGKEALPLDLLAKLEAARDRNFANAAELEGWVNGLGIASDEVRKRVIQAVPTTEDKANDEVYCLDAASGDEVWKKTWPGNAGDLSSTLCLADGKCYGLASTGEAFCLDAASGEEVWRAKSGSGHSSFLVTGGLAVALAGELTALDAKTGTLAWKQPQVKGHENSAVAWDGPDGRTYLLCNTREHVACVELKTGKVRWTAPGGSPSTVAATGEHMVVLSDNPQVGLQAYRITPDKAEKAWNRPKTIERGSSPVIHDGHVYAVAGEKTVCVELASGKLAWEGKPGKGDIASPVVADDKLFAPLANMFVAMVSATPDKYQLLDKTRVTLAPCTSPAVADGKLFVRTGEGLACYDLTADAAQQASASERG
jgi:outer membrane protein assembly factor BamB